MTAFVEDCIGKLPKEKDNQIILVFQVQRLFVNHLFIDICY